MGRIVVVRLIVAMGIWGTASLALAQSTVVDLEAEMRKQNRKPPASDQSRPKVALGTAPDTSAQIEIEVQPKTDLRTVGNLGEPLRVLRGASEIGRSEFKVSCGIGVAYAFISSDGICDDFNDSALGTSLRSIRRTCDRIIMSRRHQLETISAGRLQGH